MTSDDLRTLLNNRGTAFDEKSVPHGICFKCKTGEILNVYDSGKMSFQGKNTALANEIKALDEGGQTSSPHKQQVTQNAAAHKSKVDPLPVFVVYGHDIVSRDQLELLIRRMGLTPIILGSLPTAGDTIIEKLERYLGEHGNVGFACILLTPDDEGHKAGMPEEKKYRARQNVVLELGMVLSRIGRQRVAILFKESVELPSDINGLLYISFKERIDEVKSKLYAELREAGYTPDANALN